MGDLNFFDHSSWQPLASLGFNHSLFSINKLTVLHTWIIMLILFVSIIPLRLLLRRKKSIGRASLLSLIDLSYDLVEQTLGSFVYGHFAFVSALFIFIALCNTASLVPWLDEPTTDLNTTLALGIISFLYVQTYAIKSQGIIGYGKEYFSPFFVMFPLNVIGKIASIISISFRLFGNIFGGAIIGGIYFSFIKGSLLYQTLGLISGFNLMLALFFGLFEGLLQAFVFTILTLIYISTATQEGS